MVAKGENILFVVNPISGGNDKSGLTDYLQSFATSHSLNFKVFNTSGQNDLENLKKEIEIFQAVTVVAVGGDGTCNLVANSISGTGKTMAIVPLGSANGLATELEIPMFYEDALKLLVEGKEKNIDTVWVNQKICLHISDIGLNARIIKRFEEDNLRGILGYAKQFFKELWGARPSKFVFITENGKTFKKRAHVVAIANASKYGTGAIINPNGKMDDGKFELIIVKPYPFFGIFTIAAAIFLGYLDKNRYVEIYSYKKVKILKKKTQPLHIDGEIIEESTMVEAVINPASLKVLVPGDEKV